MTLNKPPLVSIIVPTKNEENNLRDCLDACQNQDYKNIEIIVIDNHSTDQTREIAKEYTSKVFVKRPERSAQKNFGAKRAEGQYILFLDADACLTDGVIFQCVNLVRSKGKSMVIIPERDIGKGFWSAVKALERSFYLGDDTIEAPWFYKKASFLSLGGYDESMFAGEDWDLFDRARQKGFLYGRCESFINHQIGRLTILEILKKKYYYGTNIKVLLNRDIKKGISRNPLIRKSLIKNAHFLFKTPFKYSMIFAVKFLESLAILAGVIRGHGCSEIKLSKLMTDMFYGQDSENNSAILARMDRKNWINFLKLLSANRILYYFVINLFPKYQGSLDSFFQEDLKAISVAAKVKTSQTIRTLDYLKKNFSEAILVKTYKFKPYITYDLDILMPANTKMKIPRDLIGSDHPGEQNEYQKNYFRKDLLRIDLHQDFYWQGFKFIDPGRIFKKPQIVNYFGRRTKISDFSLEFLLNCAHILFERRYITFLDFWYFKKLTKEKRIDWGIIKKQAEKYGWLSSLKSLLEEIERIDNLLKSKPVIFPVFLSVKKIFKAYQEKCWFEKKLPFFDIFYYLLARLRGLLGIKTRYPYYLHWFDFRQLK